MIPVMLVEDEFLVRVGLKTCIAWEELGYQIVAEADSAEAAMLKYAQHVPQLILTDIRLPHKSGLDLMHEIRSRDKSTRFIIISAYDDFTIAQQAIEVGVEGYFIKVNLDTQKLSQLLIQLRQEQFGGSLTRTDMPKTVLDMQTIYLNWPTLRTDARVALLRETGQPLYLLLFQAPGVSIARFTEMVDSYLSGQNLRCHYVEEPSRVWFFIAADAQHLSAAVEKLLQMSSRYLSSGVYIGVSTNYFPREDLESTIYEALLAANHPTAATACVEYYKPRSDGPVRRALKQYEELLQLGKYQLAAVLLRELLVQLLADYSVKGFLGTVYGLIGVLTVYGVNPAIFRNLLAQMDPRAIFALFETQTLELERVGTGRDNGYIKKAKEYIHSHLSQQLKVNTIAQAVHVSPNYLGKIFQAETGEYLTDYINRSKIDHAKELLAARERSVTQIAELVGIPDQRYFSKLFKKYCGVTPTEYANQFSNHPI